MRTIIIMFPPSYICLSTYALSEGIYLKKFKVFEKHQQIISKKYKFFSNIKTQSEKEKKFFFSRRRHNCHVLHKKNIHMCVDTLFFLCGYSCSRVSEKNWRSKKLNWDELRMFFFVLWKCILPVSTAALVFSFVISTNFYFVWNDLVRVHAIIYWKSFVCDSE